MRGKEEGWRERWRYAERDGIIVHTTLRETGQLAKVDDTCFRQRVLTHDAEGCVSGRGGVVVAGRGGSRLFRGIEVGSGRDEREVRTGWGVAAATSS